ncbi:MAG: SDR family NAD(P)-dependent oxidoreductase [Dehalobacterium sp.]|jgi:3-oxoacyl-[acyl-carrier protein] reductase
MNEKKVLFLTGGSKGIGKNIAIEFAKSGYQIAFTFLSDEAGAKNTANEIMTYGVLVQYYKLNVADYKEVLLVRDQVLKRFSKIDVLVNNAGIIEPSLIKDTSLDSWQRVINVNLTGAFNCMKSVIPVMEKQNYGRIITIGSIAGDKGSRGAASYSASKAGIVGLTKTAARELAEKCITVNVVSLGYMAQGITARLPERLQKNLIREIPQGKWGDVEKAAKMLVHLASEEAEYITGQSISISGGSYM